MVNGSSSSSSVRALDDPPSHQPAMELVRTPTNKSSLYTDPEMRPPIFKSTFQEIICITCVTLAPGAATMGLSCFQTALRVTSAEFGVEGGRLTWSVNSVVLANGACLLLMGGVADALGRRYSLIVGYFLYALFSLIGGFVHNYIGLCITRALMGACVACAVPASAGFLGSAYKESRRKNMALSIFALGSPCGAAIGFFIAGVCIELFSWRAFQYFLAMVFGVVVVLVIVFLPNDETRMDRKHAAAVLGKIDYGGALISLAAFTLICFSLTQVDSTERRWHTPYIIGTLVAGIVLLVLFVLYELYVPAEPLMPMALYKNLNFDLCMIISTLSFMNFQGALNYFAVVYMETIRGYSAIIVACCFLPQTIMGVLTNIFAGLTMHLIPGRIFIFTGCLGFLISTIIWATLPVHRNYFLGPFWSFVTCVVGADLIYNVANRCSLSLVAKELQSRAAGTFNTIISLAAAVGLGVNSAIVSSKYRLYGTPAQNTHPLELWHAVRYAYYFGIALEGFCSLLSLCVRIGVMGAKPETADPEKQAENEGPAM